MTGGGGKLNSTYAGSCGEWWFLGANESGLITVFRQRNAEIEINLKYFTEILFSNSKTSKTKYNLIHSAVVS